MNIILIGPRGAGKSKVSRALSKLIDFPVVSTDSLIVYESGGMPIPKYVKTMGWKSFRDLEYSILSRLEKADGIILDCGGGIIFDLDGKGSEILSERKTKLLKKLGKIILLERNFEELIDRVKGDATRPELAEAKSYAEILKKRMPHYYKSADKKYNVSGTTKEELASQIKTWLELK